jgi:hypothetical protein
VLVVAIMTVRHPLLKCLLGCSVLVTSIFVSYFLIEDFTPLLSHRKLFLLQNIKHLLNLLDGKLALIDLWHFVVVLIVVTVVVSIQDVVLDRAWMLGQVLEVMWADEPFTVALLGYLALDVLVVVVSR